MTKKSYSPLRYPGGKACLFDLIKKVMEKNNLDNQTAYAEPYVGGAGLALRLLIENLVQKIFINDIDKAIWSFWYSVLYETEAFIKKTYDTEVNMEEWHKQKAIQKNTSQNASTLELGFSTFFLNRTNRSGIIKAGVIGGLQQLGNYKIDCRFNKKALAGRIEKIALLKDRVSLYNEDALSFLDVIDKKEENIFLYIDPPYYNKGSSLYTNFYTHDDHVELSKKISTLQKPWLVTYDNVDEIKELYLNHKQAEFNLNYSLQAKRVATELLITSSLLNIDGLL